jgi:hypothetical protein
VTRPRPDPAYRLQVAILNGEIQRLAHRAGVLGSARRYRPEWNTEDAEQELIAYLLHLEKNTRSGWNPDRGAFSTWVTLAATGWVSKLGRRPPEPIEASQPDPEGAAEGDREATDPAGSPEDQLQAKQSAQEALLGDVFAFLAK